MLQVALTADDLDLVQVASRPSPMLELRTLLREPLVQRLTESRSKAHAMVGLVRSLVAQPCAPGFLFSAASDPADAIDTVVGTRRDAIRRDLDENAAAGFPLPAWTAELTQPGFAGTRTRKGLQAALTHVSSHYIEPRNLCGQPMVTARTQQWRDRATTRGSHQLLTSLHPGIRCRGTVLEIDLASGADVEAATTGAGVRIVPTLSASPGATLSSDGLAPLVLTCPTPMPAGPAPGTHLPGNPALEQLIGPNRSMLLGVIAAQPGHGTRELARLSGLAPASVSNHTKVLRTAGLTDVTRDGARVTHHLSPLGWALLLHRPGKP